MSMKFRIAGIFLIIGLGLHTYLTTHYYGLNFGQGVGDSLCNINDTISCDATSASKFSNIAGLPISILGGMANVILLIFLFMAGFGWTDAIGRMKRYTLYLSGFVAITSIVMGLISTAFIGAICLFCIGTYLCSFIVFELVRREQDGPAMPHFADDIKQLFASEKVILGSLIAIPVLGLMIHQGMLSQYNVGDIGKLAEHSLRDWNNNPLVKFDSTNAALIKGPDASEAKMIIVEFADFRCGHCKHAASSLKTFVSAHSNVRMEFFNFPLDGACNPMIQRSSGVNCRLAKAAQCAGGQSDWDLHYKIFENQEAFQRLSLLEDVDSKLKTLLPKNTDWDELASCMDSSETHKKVQRQSKIGDLARVQGTPTIYVNGRKLPNGQLLPVLEAALDSL